MENKKAGTVAFRSIAVTVGFRIGGTVGLSGTARMRGTTEMRGITGLYGTA